MPETKEQVRYQWIKPVLDKHISIEQLVKVCPFSERTIKYWLKRFREGGIKALIDKPMIPHHQPTRTRDEIVQKILKIKDDTDLGGKKIYWELEKQEIVISERTVNRILRKHGKTRKYETKREHIYKKQAIVKPGELVEIDIKYGVHFGFGRWWYQYTAIDVASRWRYLRAFENRENDYSISFLEELLKRTALLFKIEAIKTDNDAVFTNRLTGYSKSTDPLHPRFHDFDKLCQQVGITHYLITPGKPTQNGHVERSHRSDKQYFYSRLSCPTSLDEYNYQLALWNQWYNNLSHCSLQGLSPNQFLERCKTS
jgi:transposase InsO family protein